MKFLSDILAKAGLTVDGVVTLNNTATGQTPAANDNSTKLATTAWVRTFVQPYSLPIASASVLGGVKVGSGLSIDSGTGVLSVTGGGSASIKSTQTFIATAGQTVFTITGGYTPSLIDVFLNGVYLSPNQTTATNGTTVTLSEAALVGDIIDVIVASPIYQGATTTTDQLPEGTTNLYYTDARSRAAITLTVTGTSGASTYNSTTGVLNIPTYTLAGLGGVPTGRTITIDGVTYDLSANRTWNILPTGGATGDILAKVSGTNYDVTWIPNYTSQVQHQVKLGATMTVGTPVYVSGSTGNAGTNMIVSKASNAAEGTSSKTLGLIASGGNTNDVVFVVTEGLLAGLDTSTANAGDPVWLGVNGALIFGLLNKPVAPAHLVFIGVVTRAQQNNGEIFVKVQNGFELDELHDLSVKNASDGDMIKYVASTGLWTKIAATTTNITEGTNLYYTQARFDTAFAAKSTSNLAEGTNLYYTIARFDTRLATKSTTDLAEGTNLYYTTARVNSDFDTRLATKSTSNLAEGTNLYYTNARVGSYLTSNSYATQSYVNTAVSNLVDAAPGTLDTLNELAAALGDDPNFATTVASSIGTKEPIITAGTTSQYWRGDKTWQTLPVYTLSGLGGVPTSRTLTINGTAYDLSADRSWSIAAGVTSFNTRTGAITLTSGDVTGALGYTPYNSTNPNGYISSYTETDTLATVTSRGASTSTAITINGIDSALKVQHDGTSTAWRGRLGSFNASADKSSFLGNYTGRPGVFGHNNALSAWAELYVNTLGIYGQGDVYLSWFTYVKGNGNDTNYSIWHSGNLTNLNQLSNGPGYITSSSGITGASGKLSSRDIRTIAPNSENAAELRFGFTSWNNNNGSPYADYLHLRSYSDSSGGADNLVMFLKSGIGMRIYQQSFGSGTAYSSYVDVYHSGNLTNLNQLTNGPGYVTGGPYLPTAGGSISGSLSIVGNITVSSGNTTGGGIILADDGDIVDLNDAYCSMRFSYGVRIFSANRGGTAVITLSNTGSIAANGPISASNVSSSVTSNYIVQRDANGYIYANHINFSTTESENPTISSFITSNGDGWSRKSSLAHVKNSIRGIADGTWGINISGNAATSSYSSLDFRHSDRDFPAGTLVQTNINYAVESGDAFVLEIRGNSYFNTIPFDVQIQGYIYGGTIISTGGYSNGKYIDGIRAINYNGNLCFWWPSGGYWEGFNVKVYAAFASFPSNRVTSITNSSQPTTAKQVNFAPVQSLHSGNFNSYAPSLTGGNASGTWSIAITGNAGSVNSRTVGNGKGNIGYFDAQGNLYINNPESYSGEVRLGAAWNRGGIYTASTLSLSTGSSTIDMVYSDATRFRHYYDSNGSRFMVNTTSTPYTLVDTNARPIIYARGAYPVLTLDHTETTNTLHGPTIQFVFNGLDARQWVIGTAGNGSQMDFGMSNAARSNTNYNPHHGIGGYNGKTLMRITETGVLIGDCGTYPTNNTPSYALQVNGAISCNDIVRTSNFRLAGTLVLSGSGAEIGNSTGARLSESYGAVWNFSNSATWHHQVVNGSYLSGFYSSGGNFGNGNYYGTGDVTAYYSDERLKTKITTITNAIEKIKSLEGFVYVENDLARSLGYTNNQEQAGVSAQQIQAVLPQAVSLAPFDMQGVAETGEVISKTGENYLTVKYDRIVPLLIEGIKEQQGQIESQKTEIEELKDLVKQLLNRQ